MAQSVQPGRFGQSGQPEDAWLAKQGKEPILEPELPIIDTHHHLWDRGRNLRWPARPGCSALEWAVFRAGVSGGSVVLQAFAAR